jgi:hypothetical protein
MWEFPTTEGTVNQMADQSGSAPANFAEYEAAGYPAFNAAPEPAKEPAEQPEQEQEPSEGDEPETVAEPEPAKKPPATETKPRKRTLAEEHARLLKDVTELRRQRRELQTESKPPADTSALPAKQDKPAPSPRPRLSTWSGTLEELETAQEKWDKQDRDELKAQWTQEYEEREQKRQAEEQQKQISVSYGEKLSEHLKEHPEYDTEIGQTPMSPLMVEIVLHYGPQLGQSLIEDRNEAERISRLPRDVQIFEMGKLAASSNGKAAKAEPEPEEEEPEPPVKVPARLGGTGNSSVMSRPDRGAKNFAQWEAIEGRLADKKRR